MGNERGVNSEIREIDVGGVESSREKSNGFSRGENKAGAACSSGYLVTLVGHVI